MRYYMDLEHLYGKGWQPLLSAGWQDERGKLTVSGTNNRLMYCVIFMV
jgi:hypothetical protein